MKTKVIAPKPPIANCTQRMSNDGPAVANLFYGHGAGAISELKSAHDIVNEMVSGAVKRLRGIVA